MDVLGCPRKDVAVTLSWYRREHRRRRPAPDRCSYVLSRPFGFGFGQEVGDLFGEVLGAGAGQADGGDDALVASAEPDEPGSPGRLSPGAGGAGIDLDADGW